MAAHLIVNQAQCRFESCPRSHCYGERNRPLVREGSKFSDRSRPTQTRHTQSVRMARSFLEPGEPLVDKPKPMPVQPVDPCPPHSFVVEQPSGLEHLKVPRRRRPCMRETTGKVSRRALPTPQVDGEENLSPGWMRERRDHRIERI